MSDEEGRPVMAMKDRVLALLRGHEAARIRFTVPSASVPVMINHVAFAMVANAIVAGKIGVTPFASTKRALAEYDQPAGPTAPSSGSLMVPPILGRVEEAAVMHESTHAFFDLTTSNILAMEEEAVSMIVTALYHRMTGLTPTRWTGAEPFISAKAVADALLSQYQAGVSGVPAVQAGQFQTLMLAVATSPTYLIPTSLTSGTPAGLFGGFLGGPVRYVHDG
jgi:hypothetical protein